MKKINANSKEFRYSNIIGFIISLTIIIISLFDDNRWIESNGEITNILDEYKESGTTYCYDYFFITKMNDTIYISRYNNVKNVRELRERYKDKQVIYDAINPEEYEIYPIQIKGFFDYFSKFIFYWIFISLVLISISTVIHDIIYLVHKVFRTLK